MTNLAVVFQSAKGPTRTLAESILKGILSVEGVSGGLLEIRGQDIQEGRFANESLAILDFERSLKYDLELLRSSPAVPKHIKLYGFFYEINSGELIEVIEVLRDIPALTAV